MDVSCPNCATRFRIPEGAIGEDGRTVRCSKCGHTWHQMPVVAEPEDGQQADAAAEEATKADEADAEDSPPIRPEILAAGGEIDTPPPISGDLLSDRPSFEAEVAKSKSGSGLATALWLLLIVALVGALAAAWFKRDWIVANYPAAAPIYERLGLAEAEAPLPLRIDDVTSIIRRVDGERRYIITGLIQNTSEAPHAIPPMRGLILGEGGEELVRWDFQAGAGTLAGQGSMTFETSVAAPEGAQNLNIEFVVEE